jgi:class 3 adenylate cyclase
VAFGPCKDKDVAPESEDNLRLEIGHVLFLDIVGYSKLLIEEQKERLGQLTEIVLATAQVRESTNEQLVRLPTGDGMALVFRNSSEEPAQCALEIAQALKAHPEIEVRMGIHSGPVNEVIDVNERTNIAGAGINVVQWVDSGDAGHILLSRRVAEDLGQYWQRQAQLQFGGMRGQPPRLQEDYPATTARLLRWLPVYGVAPSYCLRSR